MKPLHKKIIAIFCFFIAVIFFVSLGLGIEADKSELQTKPDLTQHQAISIVRTLPEVQTWIQSIPNKSAIFIEGETDTTYKVWVFQWVPDEVTYHAATFAHYDVDKKTGSIHKEDIPIDENNEDDKTYTHLYSGSQHYAISYPKDVVIREEVHFTKDPLFEFPESYVSGSNVTAASINFLQSACHEELFDGEEVTFNSTTFIKDDWQSDDIVEKLSYRYDCLYITLVLGVPSGETADEAIKLKMTNILEKMLGTFTILQSE